MTKSELISQLAAKQPQLDYRDVELAVKELLVQMSTALAAGERIEVRGFGTVIDSSNRLFCESDGGAACLIVTEGEILSQWEARAGFSVRF